MRRSFHFRSRFSRFHPCCLGIVLTTGSERTFLLTHPLHSTPLHSSSTTQHPPLPLHHCLYSISNFDQRHLSPEGERVVESMEPVWGSVREWLLTPATSSLGFETPYLLAREVPPPLAFVLHLCQVWSPEVVIALIGLGILTLASLCGWGCLFVLRLAYWLLATVVEVVWRRRRPSSPTIRETLGITTAATAVDIPSSSSALLIADREARLRALHSSSFSEHEVSSPVSATDVVTPPSLETRPRRRRAPTTRR